MFKVIYDPEKNLLTIHYENHVDAEQGKELCEALQKQLPKCKKGFRLLVIMSLLEKMELEAREYIDKAMDLINQCGVTKVVRVIPDIEKDIGFKIMSLFHYSKNVQIMTCKSLEEGLSHL